MKIDVKALPVFELFGDGDSWGVRDGKRTIFPLPEETARLFAAGPTLLRFLASCYRPGRPLYADLQTMFGHLGLELPEPAGADVRPTTKGE